MERTDFKKAWYCKNRILLAMSRIAHAKRLRGIGPGTFWLDIEKTDEYIKEQENYIKALEKRIKHLNSQQ